MHFSVTAAPGIYHIEALEAEGFPRRTIQYYIKLGLVPPAHGRGRTAYYTDRHIQCLRRIKEARDANMTLRDLADSIAIQARFGRR